MTAQDKAAIKSMIDAGNLEEAIPAFLRASESLPLHDEVTLQSSRFNRLKQEIRNGLISKADADMSYAKIAYALIELLKKAPETPTGGGSAVLSPLQPVQIVSAGQVNTIGEMSGGSITYNAASPQGEDKAVTAKKILFLGANPKETDQLRLGQEARDIEEGIRRARQRNDYQFVTKWAVRTADLRRYLLDEYPQIVHFSGHGKGANGLVFEDNSGNTQLVEAQSLANLFSLFSNTIECVVLNACFSDVQADAIAQHIPFVVGMDNAIPDVTAVQFAVAFYEALASGRGGVEFAFNYACVAIEMDKLSGQGVPQLRKKQV